MTNLSPYEQILTESKHFIITHEFETVILYQKHTNRKVVIGDFYGEPEKAFISEQEHFCVIYGCGMIIYYLREPFQPYKYHEITNQWLEFGRDEPYLWITAAKILNNSHIEITLETGETKIITQDGEQLELGKILSIRRK